MAANTDTPDAPKKTEDSALGGSDNGTGASTPAPAQDKGSSQKTALPIAPIFSERGRSTKVELEKQKAAQQNYLVNLNQTLTRRKDSIKRAQKYLANLETAYSRAQSSGAADAVRSLTGSISQTKAALGQEQKQKTLIERYMIDANKTLSGIHERLARAQTEHESSSSTNKSPNQEKKVEESPGGSQPQQAEVAATQQPQKPKKLTPNQIKKQLKANLAAGQSKKNIKLLRQTGALMPAAPTVKTPQPFTAQPSPEITPQASSSTQPSATQPTEPVKQGIGVTRWVASKAVGATAQVVEFTGKIIRYAGKGIQIVGRSIATTLGSIPYVGIPFKALGIGINGAGKGIEGAGKSIESIAKGIGKIKQRLQMLKSVKLLAAGTPAGAAIALALRFKQLKRLIAAAIAGLLLLLYLLWIKMLGMLAGLAIGLVTGAPLLLIPGVGPFLYAGYVGYWAYKGLTDPLGTIHLATHPMELITRPLNWARDQLSNLGEATKGGVESAAGGIGNAVSGGLSAVGNFITGTASALWGGLTGTIGGAVTTAGSIAGNFFGYLAGAGSSITGNVIPVAVGGSVVSVAGATVIGTIITNSAFYTPTLDPTEQFFPPGQNELFTITKTADKNNIPNPDILETTPVIFTVTVTATQNLTNLQITDQTTASNGSTLGIGANTCQQGNLPTSIASGSNWTCTLTVNVNVEQSDTTVTNSATFTASSEDGSKTHDSTAISTVIVGSVPSGCPKNWPTTGPITQGPEGVFSHADGAFSPEGYEAIDIGKPDEVYGDPVKSTIAGKVVNIWSKADNPDNDKRIEIQPFNCPGLSFVAFWHNSSLNGLKVNDTVSYGDLIAGSGAYKNDDGSQAEHLHYQFNASGDRSFPIQEPYVPDDSYGRTCSNTSGCGVTATIL